ncbi:MAG: hypothetical protein EKK56_07795 [Flavobacteriaceae bacterium]|nr:MAG: hypothetical protein EKK56_07795 [Flavobacteriaceae bacterium]
MNLKYSKKLTINLGNYENIILELGVEDKVDLENETYDEAYNRMKNLVNTSLQQEYTKIKGVKNV